MKEMKDLEHLYKQSIKNRCDFLEKKKNEWTDCNSERQKKDLIVKLIQLDPSHLAEDWILDQIIKWMKNREENIDYLTEAFISRGCRDELTEKKQTNLAEKSFLNYKVRKLAEKKGTQAAAIRTMVLNSEDDNLPEDAEMAIIQKLKRYRKAIASRALPYPYYGKDVVIFDEGTDQQRIEFYLYNKPITFNGHAYFGNTKITYPIKEKSPS